MLPRRFALVRHVDYTGVSGVGVVAFGIAFSDGHVALRWCSIHPATSTWGSLEDMLAVHGHGEATSIQWIDAPAHELEELPGASRVGRRARRRAERDAADADDESPTGEPDVEAEPAVTQAEPDAGPGPLANGHPRPREPAVEVPSRAPGVNPADDGDSDTVPALPRPVIPGRHRRSDQVDPRR
ncbi:MAG: hypothetical protein ACRDVN_09440 [Jiangellaceae bacterium]